MQCEYDAYDLDEDAEHAERLARGGHVGEDAEYVYRQQGQYYGLDRHRDYVAELHGDAAHGVAVQVSHTESEHEGEHEGRHDSHHGWYLHRKVGVEPRSLGCGLDLYV